MTTKNINFSYWAPEPEITIVNEPTVDAQTSYIFNKRYNEGDGAVWGGQIFNFRSTYNGSIYFNFYVSTLNGESVQVVASKKRRNIIEALRYNYSFYESGSFNNNYSDQYSFQIHGDSLDDLIWFGIRRTNADFNTPDVDTRQFTITIDNAEYQKLSYSVLKINTANSN